LCCIWFCECLSYAERKGSAITGGINSGYLSRVW
jgi:hypothetical protein